ncbi:hypothetical protein HK405_008400, partial [Cladochytrium tenue]
REQSDFFGRTVEPSNDTGGGATGGSAPAPARVVYRFNEGFSNAVRKPLKMRDFL